MPWPNSVGGVNVKLNTRGKYKSVQKIQKTWISVRK